MEKHTDDRKSLIHMMCAPPGDAVAQALRAWRLLAVELCPLIGESGFCALFGRALRLLPPDAQWLATQGARGIQGPEGAFAMLEAALTGTDEATGREANAVLLETFTKLLSGLIGETLTIRLLNSAWQSTSEHKNTGVNADER